MWHTMSHHVAHHVTSCGTRCHKILRKLDVGIYLKKVCLKKVEERSVPREVCPKKMVERSSKSLTLVRAPSEPAPVVEGDLPVMDEVISMKSSGSW